MKHDFTEDGVDCTRLDLREGSLTEACPPAVTPRSICRLVILKRKHVLTACSLGGDLSILLESGSSRLQAIH